MCLLLELFVALCLVMRVARTGAGRARRNPWCPPRCALGARPGGQRRPELPARADVELLEDVPQVPFDGARTEEELRSDLGIRVSIARERRDLRLLRGELRARVVCPLARRRAGREQLAGGTAGEAVGPGTDEKLVGGSQRNACVGAPIRPAEPFA